jgi:hypothetical protein
MDTEQPEDRPIRSDVEAHDRAMSMSMQGVVRDLVEILGATTVAVIGGVTETRAVAQWMQNREPQRPHVLRFAYQLALMLASSLQRETARAWFHGSNPRLGDRSPMMLLRDKPLEELRGPMLDAARAFARRT